MNFSRKLLFFFLSRNFASTTGNPCRGEIPLINNVCFRRQVWKKKKNWKEEKIEKKSRNRRSLIKFHKSFSCYGSIHQVTSRNQTSLAFMEICRKPSCWTTKFVTNEISRITSRWNVRKILIRIGICFVIIRQQANNKNVVWLWCGFRIRYENLTSIISSWKV